MLIFVSIILGCYAVDIFALLLLTYPNVTLRWRLFLFRASSQACSRERQAFFDSITQAVRCRPQRLHRDPAPAATASSCEFRPGLRPESFSEPPGFDRDDRSAEKRSVFESIRRCVQQYRCIGRCFSNFSASLFTHVDRAASEDDPGRFGNLPRSTDPRITGNSLFVALSIFKPPAFCHSLDRPLPQSDTSTFGSSRNDIDRRPTGSRAGSK